MKDQKKVEKTESTLGNVVYVYRGHAFSYDRHKRCWQVSTQQWRGEKPIFKACVSKEACIKCIDYLIEVDGEREEDL